MNTSTTPHWLNDYGNSSRAAVTNLSDPVDEFSLDDNKKTDEASSGSRYCSIEFLLLSFASLALLGLFVYAAIMQDNDVDGLQWIIFYALNAAVCLLFLVHYTCCFPVIAIPLLSAVTAIWAVVYIVIASRNVKETPTGGAEDGTGDNDNQTLREEYIYELAGASIGLFSSLYHTLMAQCCVKKGDKVEDTAEQQNVLWYWII